MGAACDRMQEVSRDLFRWIFPERIDIPECLRRLYEALYPNVDWDEVSFHLGKPFFAKSDAIRGITLPDFYGVREIKVYFRPDVYDPCTCAGLITPVHEAYHVQQYEEILAATGVGFLRGFMIAYLAGAWRGGSSGHAMEAPAHAYDERFLDCCTGSPCDCSTDPPGFSQANLDALLAGCPDLVVTDTGVSFWELLFDATPGGSWLWEKGNELGVWACTLDRDDIELEAGRGVPGSSGCSWTSIGKWILRCSTYGFLSLIIRLIAIVWTAIWSILWTVLTIVLAVLIPLVEGLLLIVDGILWVVTGIVCAAEWLWARITDALTAVCEWSENLERRCAAWEERRTQECAREEDQGYNECARKEDQGYNECTRKEDQGHRDCCDWWPCSWACDAWVWVSNIVCVAWTWVSNVVCVAWTWVSHVVCVAWTWVVSRVCIAFTWVVTGLTCWAR